MTRLVFILNRIFCRMGWHGAEVCRGCGKPYWQTIGR